MCQIRKFSSTNYVFPIVLRKFYFRNLSLLLTYDSYIISNTVSLNGFNKCIIYYDNYGNNLYVVSNHMSKSHMIY